jgi:hypothetical protein
MPFRSGLDHVEPDLEFVHQLQQLGQRRDVGLDRDLAVFGLGEQRRLAGAARPLRT